MKQLDLFQNELDQQTKKIYESPDKGKTIYSREFGADPSNRILVKTAVQQQWTITYKGMKV